jgi:hypothetical protein
VIKADPSASLIHAWIFFRDLYNHLHTERKKLCPHCHGNLRVSSINSAYNTVPEYDEAEHVHETKQEYGRIRVEDNEAGPSATKNPRPSTDDETARLV